MSDFPVLHGILHDTVGEVSMVHDFDRITIATLRERGGLNWSLYPDAIGSMVAEMDFGCAPEIQQALHVAVDEHRFGYLPPVLVAEMARACAGWLSANFGWEVATADIRPVGDVIAALETAIEHFSPTGSAIVVPTPAYKHFLDVPQRLGRKVVEVPMILAGQRWEFDLDGLDRAFTDGAGLLILCSPYNPLGRVFTADELGALSEVVDRHGVRVFADEIHCPLVLPGARHTPYATVSAAAAGHSVTALSASKAWNLAGLKCAQVVLTNDADRVTWAELGLAPEIGTSNLGLAANAAAFRSGREWLRDVLRYVDRNRTRLGELVEQQLPGVVYRPPEGTYLAWLDFTAVGLGDQPAKFFHERAGVVSTEGLECGQAGGGCLRLNLATPEPILVEIVERMGRALAGR
ncbi:MAG: aminotransferase class I/II-fold pyridoxal phosphate-dependent enzyme [Actinomycetota bacterium]|nr:aminotransferase class I/II-fold pyridoxal phosphate-dependent enzyme [Actinomycetota bacterium]